MRERNTAMIFLIAAILTTLGALAVDDFLSSRVTEEGEVEPQTTIIRF